MKRLAKFIAVGMLIIMDLGLFAGCWGNGETAYFTYYIDEKIMDDVDRYVTITGLTKKGHQQKALVIPEKIKGKYVTRLGKLRMGEYERLGENDVLEKLYLESVVSLSVFKTLDGFTKLEKIIVMNALSSDSFITYHQIGNVTNYLTRAHYDEQLSKSQATIVPANISYYYNYDTSQTYSWRNPDKQLGYHWIDDVGYGEKIEFIPPTPTRDGYNFGGWYKETECIHEWNFESDTLPQKQIDTYGRTIYQETVLYAKWIKK